jgi:hypothetical protein
MDLAEIFKTIKLHELHRSLQKYESRFNKNMTQAVVAELQRRADSAPVQTQALYHPSQLFAQKVPLGDDSGRVTTQYSGDPAAWG